MCLGTPGRSVAGAGRPPSSPHRRCAGEPLVRRAPVSGGPVRDPPARLRRGDEREVSRSAGSCTTCQRRVIVDIDRCRTSALPRSRSTAGRKRVGVEPTKNRLAALPGFEVRTSHRGAFLLHGMPIERSRTSPNMECRGPLSRPPGRAPSCLVEASCPTLPGSGRIRFPPVEASDRWCRTRYSAASRLPAPKRLTM